MLFMLSSSFGADDVIADERMAASELRVSLAFDCPRERMLEAIRLIEPSTLQATARTEVCDNV
jgi:hypothetical protein